MHECREDLLADYAEIAAVLGISIGTVESRLHRARARLKAKLERHMRRPGAREAS